MGNLTQLGELWFGGNDLSGELPFQLSRLKYMEVLDLDSNRMGGTIPAWLGELRNLRKIYLENNRFNGELPAELGKLTRLETLYLHGNRQLSGTLPETLTAIEELWSFRFR